MIVTNSMTYNSSQMHFVMLKEKGTAPIVLKISSAVSDEKQRDLLYNGDVHYKKKNGTMVSIYMYSRIIIYKSVLDSCFYWGTWSIQLRASLRLDTSYKQTGAETNCHCLS